MNNDQVEQRVRSYFASVEDDAPPMRPLPVASPGPTRVRPHRAVRVGLAFAAVGGLVLAVVVVRARTEPSPHTAVGTVPTQPSSAATIVHTPATFPAADAEAQNFLVVGADNNACADPASDTAGGFGDRTSLGERSDTIMMVRVAPETGHVAILSFPRDLWVTIDGTNTSGRINSAFSNNNPQRLVNTIFQNFGITVDHYIQVDFCGFKRIVDAVGGVAIPFERPVRDQHTGLAVLTAGCRTLDGDEALAYVRSRHLEYLDADGAWQQDPSSDLGRIGRQQDFIWRTLLSATASGLSDPGTAAELINTVLADVVTDAGFTIDTALQLAGVLRDVRPAMIQRAQIAGTPTVIAGSAVLTPNMADISTQAAIAMFRGEGPPAAPPAASEPEGSAPLATVSPGILPDGGVTC